MASPSRPGPRPLRVQLSPRGIDFTFCPEGAHEQPVVRPALVTLLSSEAAGNTASAPAPGRSQPGVWGQLQLCPSLVTGRWLVPPRCQARRAGLRPTPGGGAAVKPASWGLVFQQKDGGSKPTWTRPGGRKAWRACCQEGSPWPWDLSWAQKTVGGGGRARFQVFSFSTILRACGQLGLCAGPWPLVFPAAPLSPGQRGQEPSYCCSRTLLFVTGPLSFS